MFILEPDYVAAFENGFMGWNRVVQHVQTERTSIEAADLRTVPRSSVCCLGQPRVETEQARTGKRILRSYRLESISN